ncbi:MAG: hypothetical protein COY82_01220 [Parcubacteria group bacterium CG_4_10_14_0_8_um_filter_35_7]|nr:MAG: hypothetical protein COY82_01220 [Parcubacteria group bacterium CG_4_10_14_0_8_um_filter_35_7]
MVAITERSASHFLIDKSFSFLPKNEYKLAAEQSEAASSDLRNSNWRCVFVKIFTYFKKNPDDDPEVCLHQLRGMFLACRRRRRGFASASEQK